MPDQGDPDLRLVPGLLGRLAQGLQGLVRLPRGRLDPGQPDPVAGVGRLGRHRLLRQLQGAAEVLVAQRQVGGDLPQGAGQGGRRGQPAEHPIGLLEVGGAVALAAAPVEQLDELADGPGPGFALRDRPPIPLDGPVPALVGPLQLGDLGLQQRDARPVGPAPGDLGQEGAGPAEPLLVPLALARATTEGRLAEAPEGAVLALDGPDLLHGPLHGRVVAGLEGQVEEQGAEARVVGPQRHQAAPELRRLARRRRPGRRRRPARPAGGPGRRRRTPRGRRPAGPGPSGAASPPRRAQRRARASRRSTRSPRRAWAWSSRARAASGPVSGGRSARPARAIQGSARSGCRSRASSSQGAGPVELALRRQRLGAGPAPRRRPGPPARRGPGRGRPPARGAARPASAGPSAAPAAPPRSGIPGPRRRPPRTPGAPGRPGRRPPAPRRPPAGRAATGARSPAPAGRPTAPGRRRRPVRSTGPAAGRPGPGAAAGADRPRASGRPGPSAARGRPPGGGSPRPRRAGPSGRGPRAGPGPAPAPGPRGAGR